MFKGTIIENSLADRSVLDELKIEKTYHHGSWTLHDVWIDKHNLNKLSKALSTGPWYIHVWEPGKDDIQVIFRGKTFKIKHANKTTWQEAIEYGKSIGIPMEQLDFPIE